MNVLEGGSEGLLTSWTTKLAHNLYTRGPLSMVRFPKQKNTKNKHKWAFWKSLGSFTRCNLDVDLEKWPCTKKWLPWFFQYMSQKGQFWDFFGLFACLTFSSFASSSLVSMFNYHEIWSNKEKIKSKLNYISISLSTNICSERISFVSLTANPLDHDMDNVGMKRGLLMVMVTLMFFFYLM